MNYEKLILELLNVAKNGDFSRYFDSFDVIRELENVDANEVYGKKGERSITYDKTHFGMAHKYSKVLRMALDGLLRDGNLEYKIASNSLKDKKPKEIDAEDIAELYGKTLLFDAKYDFDCYLRYIEIDRPKEKKFYIPRRPQLYPIVEAMQDLADDKLDILAISLPPGVGKSTLAIFYLCWLAGRNPELQILGGSHSNSFLRGVYDECLRIFEPYGEYRWQDVFPKVHVVETNAKDMRIDLGSAKRFQTLEFSSIGSGNAGKVRATNLLYCDDLVEGIEQAMSRERLDKLWQGYSTDLRQRKQGNVVKELHIATRWSVHDVIGRLEDLYMDNDRAKFIKVSAVDENDNSNFDYPYGVGFTTKFYHEQREAMDDVSWRALYLNQPIEREGLLYSEEQLRRYFELPNGEPDGIYAVCDTKTTGSDYCVMPILYQYGSDFYVEDIFCENYAPDIVENGLINVLCKYNPHLAQFESNVAGGKLAQVIQEKIKERGCKTRITTKWTQQNKETKIQVEQPYIINHFLFKDESIIKETEFKEYRLALQQLCGYTLVGKNKHDDVPDAMAQASQFVQKLDTNKVIISRRAF